MLCFYISTKQLLTAASGHACRVQTQQSWHYSTKILTPQQQLECNLDYQLLQQQQHKKEPQSLHQQLEQQQLKQQQRCQQQLKEQQQCQQQQQHQHQQQQQPQLKHDEGQAKQLEQKQKQKQQQESSDLTACTAASCSHSAAAQKADVTVDQLAAAALEAFGSKLDSVNAKVHEDSITIEYINMNILSELKVSLLAHHLSEAEWGPPHILGVSEAGWTQRNIPGYTSLDFRSHSFEPTVDKRKRGPGKGTGLCAYVLSSFLESYSVTVIVTDRDSPHFIWMEVTPKHEANPGDQPPNTIRPLYVAVAYINPENSPRWQPGPVEGAKQQAGAQPAQLSRCCCSSANEAMKLLQEQAADFERVGGHVLIIGDMNGKLRVQGLEPQQAAINNNMGAAHLDEPDVSNYPVVRCNSPHWPHTVCRTAAGPQARSSRPSIGVMSSAAAAPMAASVASSSGVSSRIRSSSSRSSSSSVYSNGYTAGGGVLQQVLPLNKQGKNLLRTFSKNSMQLLNAMGFAGEQPGQSTWFKGLSTSILDVGLAAGDLVLHISGFHVGPALGCTDHRPITVEVSSRVFYEVF